MLLLNEVCRIPGIMPKTIVDWFGHDLKTAIEHFNKKTRQDYDRALEVDPFKDSVIGNGASPSAGSTSGYILSENGRERPRTNKKTPGNMSFPEHAKAVYDPYGNRTRVAGVKGQCPNR